MTEIAPNLAKAPPLGEARDRELLKEAHSFLYHRTPHGDLASHFFFPWGHSEDASAPIVVFFHGGLWDASMPTQFIPHCHFFTARGAVAATVEYRVRDKHGTGVLEALEDAATVAVFLRENAKVLGIDPGKIIFAGAGSGAHLALACGTLPRIGERNPEDYRPAALLLCSPIVDTTKGGVGVTRFPSPREAETHSPSKFLKKRQPPAMIFHGKLDRIVPFEQVEKFARKYHRKNPPGELIGFDGAAHTFFNYNTNEQNYEIIMHSSDHFLVDLGLLAPDPLAGDY